MPSDREQAKQLAELAHEFFIRLEARGHSRQECTQLTASFILSRRVELPEDQRPEWERGIEG